ncbi:hypothetical protein HN51_003869 [Arachis hypogaea]
MQDGRAEPLIVVIQYFKAMRWNGKTSIQSHFEMSHIEPDLKDVFQNLGARAEKLKQGAVSVKIIEEVLIQHEFYKSYRKCPKKVETPIENRYECGKCGHTHRSAALRFNVEVMVFDRTGSIRLLLWDKKTSMLYGKRAEQIMEDHVIVGDEYPKTLDNMMDKRVFFKINIKEANINQFDHVYTVMKICDDEDIIDKNLPKELSTNLLSNDVMEECISSLKYQTPSKRITNVLKNSSPSLDEHEEEG